MAGARGRRRSRHPGVTVGKKSLRQGAWLFMLGFVLLIALFWAHKYLLFWLAHLCCSVR